MSVAEPRSVDAIACAGADRVIRCSARRALVCGLLTMEHPANVVLHDDGTSTWLIEIDPPESDVDQGNSPQTTVLSSRARGGGK